MVLSSVRFLKIYHCSEINCNAGTGNFVYVGECCVIRAWPQILKKWEKPHLKLFLRKSFDFRIKMENLGTLIVLKISCLTTLFVFELIGVGAALNVSEPLKLLKMFLCISRSIQWLLFVIYFTKIYTTFKFLAFDMNGRSGS